MRLWQRHFVRARRATQSNDVRRRYYLPEWTLQMSLRPTIVGTFPPKRAVVANTNAMPNYRANAHKTDLPKLNSMWARRVVNNSATARTVQMLDRCAAKPRTNASSMEMGIKEANID